MKTDLAQFHPVRNLAYYAQQQKQRGLACKSVCEADALVHGCRRFRACYVCVRAQYVCPVSLVEASSATICKVPPGNFLKLHMWTGRDRETARARVIRTRNCSVTGNLGRHPRTGGSPECQCRADHHTYARVPPRFAVSWSCIPAQRSKLQSCINAYSLNLDHHPSDHHYHDDDPGGLHCAAGTFHASV